MSYNIDTIHFLNGKLSISKEEFLKTFEEVADEIPEDSLFHRDDVELIKYRIKRADGKRCEAVASKDCPEEIVWSKQTGNSWQDNWKALRWCYAGSGSTFDAFKKVLTKTKGKADLLIIWEGGDSVNGLRINNGVVTEHGVDYVLKD